MTFEDYVEVNPAAVMAIFIACPRKALKIFNENLPCASQVPFGFDEYV